MQYAFVTPSNFRIRSIPSAVLSNKWKRLWFSKALYGRIYTCMCKSNMCVRQVSLKPKLYTVPRKISINIPPKREMCADGGAYLAHLCTYNTLDADN